ncbi:MAG: ABC transporter permease [Acidimicrobiales bacterium]
MTRTQSWVSFCCPVRSSSSPTSSPTSPLSCSTPEPAVGERFLRNRLATAGTVVLLMLTLFAFVGPLIWTYDHRFQPEISSDSPPSLDHPFGTSRSGHDLLGQAMRGTQQSLRVAMLAGVLAAVIGTAWGAVAGLSRGSVDAVLMRIVDVVLTVPILVIVLALAGGGDGTDWFQVGAMIGLLSWATVARVARGLTVSVCAHEYVDTARALGASDRRILVEHVLPNIAGAAAVAGTVIASAAVVVEAALSFLGFGITAPDTSLGRLVGTAQDAAFTRPWLFVIPGTLLTVLCVSLSLVGDGLADALDVRR